MGEVFSHASHKFERTSVRTYYSNIDLSRNAQFVGDSNRANYDFANNNDTTPTQSVYNARPTQRLRSPSLPSIRQRNFSSREMPSRRHEEDTSGYTSDSGNNCQSPDVWRRDEAHEKRQLSKNYKNSQNYDRSLKGHYYQDDRDHHPTHPSAVIHRQGRTGKVNPLQSREQALIVAGNGNFSDSGNDNDEQLQRYSVARGWNILK